MLLLRSCVRLMGIALAAGVCGPVAAAPVNVAREAAVTASSVHSAPYAAAFAADGRIADAGTRDSAGTEWAAAGNEHPDGVVVTFTWPEPRTIAELVYYSRSSFAVEGFKDYEVLLDGSGVPVCRGTLASGHGPQRITLPEPVAAKALSLRFTSSYPCLNPGAAEIGVYSSPAPDSVLGAFIPLPAYGERFKPIPESPALAARLRRGEFGFREFIAVRRHVLNPSHIYTYHAESFRGGGGLYVCDPVTGEATEIVASPEGEIIDTDVSFDGREILFSWKQRGRSQDRYDPVQDFDAEGTYQVYRIRADGTGLTQLTEGRSNNFNACWLPDGGIAFLSDRKSAFAYCFTTTSPILYRMDRDGGGVRRLSSSYLNDFTPGVLSDGRIVYSRWEYVNRPAIPIQGLWAMNPDGTNVSGVFGNRVISPGTFMEAHPMPGEGDRLLCVLTSHNGPCRGAIGLVDVSFDANAQAAIRNLTPEVDIGLVDRGDGNGVAGPYESPWPVGPEHFLVSKDGTLILRDIAGTEQVTLLKSEGLGYYHARPLAPRLRPPVVPSALPVDPEGEWASVLLRDVTHGLGGAVAAGEIREICVVQEVEKSQRIALCDTVPTGSGYASNSAFGYQFPLVSCGATYAGKRVLGFVPVEPDGSAHFKVPSGIPVYFLALDAEGRTVQRMRTFTHFMAGETQSCVGCHADRNYVTAAVSRRPIAGLLPARDLSPPEWGEGNFAYAETVQPVLDAHCVRCHNSRQHPNGVDLSGDKTDFFSVSYDVLCRTGTPWARHPEAHGGPQPEPAYIRWISTANGSESNIRRIAPREWGSPPSKLTRILLSGHPDGDGRPRVDVPDRDRRRVFMWMDLNIPYYGEVKTNYPRRMGCRRMLPPELAPVLADVAQRRCSSCHSGGEIPRTFYTRMLNPEDNGFLLAPLAKSAGGTEACGEAVFASRDDADYRAILATFAPVRAMLAETPRMDMPGGLEAWLRGR